MQGFWKNKGIKKQQKNPKSPKEFLHKILKNPFVSKDKALKGKKAKTIKTRMSIRMKLIISFLALSIVPIVTVGIVSYQGAFTTVEQQTTQFSTQLLHQMKLYLEQNIEQMEQLSMLLITNTEINKIVTKDSSMYGSIYEKLEDQKKVDSFFQENILLDTNIKQAVFYKSAEEFKNYGTNDLSYTYFQKGIFEESEAYKKIVEAQGRAVWLSGLEGNYNQIYLARSIHGSAINRPAGIFILVLSPEWLQGTFKSIDLGESVDIFALDSDQMIVAHTDLTQIGGELTRDYGVERLYDQDDEGTGNFLANQKMICYMDLINGWKMVTEIPISSMLGEIQQVGSTMLGLAILCLIIAIFIAMIISWSIPKPVKSLMKLMQDAEQGDLTIEAPFKGKNEMGRFSQSFNIMINKIKTLIFETQEALSQVIEHVNVVDQVAMETASASRQVATAVEAIASGAMDQAKDAENTTYAINQLASEINTMVETMQVITEVTEQTKLISNNAAEIIETLNTKTQQSTGMSEKIQNDIQVLEQQAKEIVQVVKLIEAISDQTNLLSLNAAIEAARAGEAGRGFTVVADQVRKLADQSKASTKMISGMIQGIQKEILDTRAVVEQGDAIYKQQEVAVQQTEYTFEDIVKAMNEITLQVNNVNQAMEGVDAIKANTIEAIESIAAIAEESAASTQQVTASGQEQVAAAEQLAHLAEQLKKTVDTLTAFMERFKI